MSLQPNAWRCNTPFMNTRSAISTRLALLAAVFLCNVSGTHAQTPCEPDRLVTETRSAYVAGLSFTTDGALYLLDPITKTLGVVNLPAGLTLPRTLLSDLRTPLAVAASGAGVYFTEGGT